MAIPERIAVGAHCPTCSNADGGLASAMARAERAEIAPPPTASSSGCGYSSAGGEQSC
jgi:hypothetical protein